MTRWLALYDAHGAAAAITGQLAQTQCRARYACLHVEQARAGAYVRARGALS